MKLAGSKEFFDGMLGKEPSGGRQSISAPPGIHWAPGQAEQFSNIIRKESPGTSAHFIRGHGGGSFGAAVTRPRHRLSNDPEDMRLNADNTRSIADLLVAGKHLHGGTPDLVFMGNCNKQYADLPLLARDALGSAPTRMVYATPGRSSNPAVSEQALRYALKTNRGLFLPKEQQFVDPALPGVNVRGRVEPLVAPSVSVPVASGAAAALLYEAVQRYRKKKTGWGGRLAAGAAGAGAGVLGLMLAQNHRRERAYDSAWAPAYKLPDGGEESLAKVI